jgi:exonuclease SbcC
MRKREFFVAQKINAEARHAELERLIESAARACELMLEAPNPHVERLERVQAESKAAALAYKAAQSERRQAVAKQMRMDFWKAAFRRVRLFMVKRILAQLEVETGAAAAALGLIGWKVSFATELETKAGTLRPGIHITVSSPISTAPWEVWSGGEGQRIRLAVALGLASMIQRMAGVSINFEVWDEPTAHLGAEGIDDLFECLRHRVFTTGKSIWICDHGRLSQSAFTEIWQATKTEMGSSIKLISNQAD